MTDITRVAILEDHPAIADGYRFYLQNEPEIQLVATVEVGEDLPIILAEQDPIHVLILDVGVPTSHTNSSPYPILFLMPQLLQRYPGLNILVISMRKEKALIKALMDCGASGYVFKDDRETLQKFSTVIRMISTGGIYFSREAHQLISRTPTESANLSPRQLEVLSLCAAYPDKTTAEIAETLGVASATVRNTLSVLYLRLGVRGRTAAMAKARELGLIADVHAYPLADQSPDANAAPVR